MTDDPPKLPSTRRVPFNRLACWLWQGAYGHNPTASAYAGKFGTVVVFHDQEEPLPTFEACSPLMVFLRDGDDVHKALLRMPDGVGFAGPNVLPALANRVCDPSMGTALILCRAGMSRSASLGTYCLTRGRLPFHQPLSLSEALVTVRDALCPHRKDGYSSRFEPSFRTLVSMLEADGVLPRGAIGRRKLEHVLRQLEIPVVESVSAKD